MTDDERRAFLEDGTRTAHLATTRQDGRPHVAPVWFVLDGDDVIFTTHEDTVKGRTLQARGRAALTVDDPHFPYAFVTLEGPVEVSKDLDDLYRWAVEISRRYVPADQVEDFARRNAVPGELLVRMRPDTVVSRLDMAGWD
jgi:PPOX class probable F420-dependent enzyme